MANQKRITQLPIINALSGSANGASIIPVVVGGTTNQIIVERFSEFVNAYNATTSSNTFIGNQTISGSLVVTNDIRAERYYIETISSSVIYESGSTEFGNTLDDNHNFTGSLLVTGSVILNGTAIGIGQLNEQTASQDLVNLQISSTTGSINTTTASFDAVFLGISSVTGAMNTQSSSQDLVNLQISSTTGSINTTTASFDSVFLQISSTTGSINTTTASFDSVFLQISSTTGSINTTTSSFDSVFLGISSVTGAMNTQSSSQDLVNLQISSTTGSINTTTSSFDSVFFGISVVTSSIDAHILGVSTQTASQELVNNGISAVTGAFATEFGSINQHIVTQATQTSSQDGVNLGISIATGSLIGITNELMAFTASLDDSYATNEELYQLYQATASIHSTTASLNTQTGSQNSINSGISAVTGAFATELGSVDAHILGVSNQTASQDGVNLGISTFTGSLRNEVNGIEAYTASLKGAIEVSGQDVNVLGMITAQQFNVTLVSSSVQYQSGSTQFGDTADDTHTFTGTINLNGLALGTSELMAQTSSQDGVNLSISTFTGSLREEVNGIEAYTASLKGAEIVSSSTQIENYNLFAVTSSANTLFYGSVSGSSLQASQLDIDVESNLNTGAPLKLYDSTNTNRWDFYHYTDNTLRLNYNGSGGDEFTLFSDGGVNFSGDITGSSVISRKSSTDTTFGDVPNIQVINTATATTNQYSGIRYRFEDGTYNGNSFIGALRESGTSSGHSLILAPANTGGGNPSEGLRVNSSGNVSVNSTSNTAKFRVYNPTNDGTYGSKIQAVFGVNDYLDSDATNIFGGGITETQFGNGATNRPAVISLGGNLNADETLGVINFFSSTNDDGYRSRANIHGAYINTGTAGKYGGELRFMVAADNVTNPQESFRLAYDGDVKVLTGNLVIGTSGKGIDFSATANSPSGSSISELLDDYEEGSWTPTLEFGGNSVGVTYSVRQGTYTKIGRQVIASCFIILTNKGSSTSTARIQGLPFTVSDYNVASVRTDNVGFTGYITGYSVPGQDKVEFNNNISGSSVTALTDTDFTNSSTVMLSISYNV